MKVCFIERQYSFACKLHVQFVIARVPKKKPDGRIFAKRAVYITQKRLSELYFLIPYSFAMFMTKFYRKC